MTLIKQNKIYSPGEGSQDVNSLLKRLSYKKADKVRRSTGHPLSDHERGLMLQQLRRCLAVCSVSAQSSCLLSRLGRYGPGASLAANRRSQDMRAQELVECDLVSHFEAQVKGERTQDTWMSRVLTPSIKVKIKIVNMILYKI